MLLRSSKASWLVGPLLLVASAACSKRNLDVGGDGVLPKPDASGNGGLGSTDAGPPDGSPGDTRPPLGGAGGGVTRLDAQESTCVTVATPLPWVASPSAPLRLSVVAGSDSVAVMNRSSSACDVRTYAYDGTALGGFQFQADAQLLPYRDDRFLLVARGTTGDFVATVLGRSLTGGTRLYTATATATEHMLGAILQGTNVLLLTDENFVSFAAGGGAPWTSILGEGDRDAFKTGRLWGLTGEADRLLIAWGVSSILRLAVVTTAGALVARADDTSFFGVLGSQTATAFPYGSGLLLFDGNPVRMTEIGFDLSRQTIGQNMQLQTFYRTTPQVAAITLAGSPIAFWLTVFPGTDRSQGSTTHQLYGCVLDLTAPGSCASTALIADTGLGGYAISNAPVAAAALPDGSGFAIASSDVTGQSWLRMANLGCAGGVSGP